MSKTYLFECSIWVSEIVTMGHTISWTYVPASSFLDDGPRTMVSFSFYEQSFSNAIESAPGYAYSR